MNIVIKIHENDRNTINQIQSHYSAAEEKIVFCASLYRCAIIKVIANFIFQFNSVLLKRDVSTNNFAIQYSIYS